VEITTPTLGAPRYRVIQTDVLNTRKTLREVKPPPETPAEPGPDGWVIGGEP
jgi:hypothetical protein